MGEKRLYGVGIGPGDPDLITIKGVNAIQDSDCIFMPKSKDDSLAGSIAEKYLVGKQTVDIRFPMGKDNKDRYVKAAQLINEQLAEGQSGAFLTLGDPLIYSTFIYLAQEVEKLGIKVEIVPGITSFSAAAAVLTTPVVVRDESLYVADGEVDVEILNRIDSVCVLKAKKDMKNTLDKLENAGFEYTLVKRCTQASEAIVQDRELIIKDTEYMALLFARRK